MRADCDQLGPWLLPIVRAALAYAAELARDPRDDILPLAASQ